MELIETWLYLCKWCLHLNLNRGLKLETEYICGILTALTTMNSCTLDFFISFSNQKKKLFDIWNFPKLSTPVATRFIIFYFLFFYGFHLSQVPSINWCGNLSLKMLHGCIMSSHGIVLYVQVSQTHLRVPQEQLLEGIMNSSSVVKST